MMRPNDPRRAALVTAGVLLGLVVAPPLGSTQTSEPRSEAPAGFWDFWGDGQAELAGYRITQPRYGEARDGEAVLITVTEDFTRSARVKSSGGHKDAYPVIKLNEVRDFTTGIYDYNLMTSVFVPLDGSEPRGRPTKLSFSSQEWCGHVWEQWLLDPESSRRVLHSYFDGEADSRETRSTPQGGLFADAMPLLVRGLVGPLLKPGESRTVPWMRSAADRRLLHLPATWQEATIQRDTTPRTLVTPAGTFEVETWSATTGSDKSTWWVEVAAPHRLIGWDRSSGETGRLSGVFRSAYWAQASTDDEPLRSRLGLERGRVD